MARPRARLAAYGLLAALALAAPARAALQWYQSYELGLEAANDGDWAGALGHFEEAARVRREPALRVRTYGTQFLFAYDPAFHQARCLAELGRLEEARRLLAAAEEAAVTAPSALETLRSRLEVLAAERRRAPPEAPAADPGAGEATRAQAARLVVRSTPAGALVRLDGRNLGSTPLAGREVGPGRHRVELRLPGRAPWSEVVDLRPGEHLQLDVTLASEAAAGATAESLRPAASPPAGRVAAERTGPDPLRDETAPSGAQPEESAPGSEAVPGRTAAEAAEVAAALPRIPVAPPVIEAGGPDPARPASEAPARRPLAWGAAFVGAASALALTLAGRTALRRRRRGVAGGAELPGRIGRYRVTGELGRGGMATTYRAVRARDGLPVAVKIPHRTGDPTYLPRFLREGRLGETLHHPRIVRILEAGEDAGRPFLAMELIPGRTLRAALDDAGGRFGLRHALEIARDVAEALDYAHGKGVVHRDLKPENVMLLPDGTVKVMDFGVARVEGQPGLTASSFFFGSPVYAAPELVDPPSIDHRADLYSLGVVLFELLQGQPPFHHESVFKLLEMHQRSPLPDPQALPRVLPADVWSLLRRLLAKDPAARYAGAQELLVDLERLLYELPSGALDDLATEPADAADRGRHPALGS